jgi:PAS domain S-box-containing protein
MPNQTASTPAEDLSLTLAQVQAMFNKSMAGMGLFDAQGQHVLHSASALKVFRTTEEQLNAGHLPRIQQALGDEFTAASQAVMADGIDRRLFVKGRGTAHQALDLDVVLSRLMIQDQPYLMMQAIDISASHGALEALELANWQLTFSIETARLGTAYASQAGQPAFWNERLFDILDIPPKDRSYPIHRSAFFERVHPKDLGAVQAAYTQALQSGAASIKHRLVRRDGGLTYVASQVRVAPGSSEVPGAIQVVVQDITEQVKLEGMNANLRTMLDQSPDYIAYVDVHQNVQFMNQGGLKLTGLPEDTDLTQLKLAAVHPPETLHTFENAASTARREHRKWRGEVELLTAYGKRVPVDAVIYPFLDRLTGKTMIAGVMRDLTAQHRHTQELNAAMSQARQAQLEMGQLLHAGSFTAAIYDRQRVMLACNEAYAELFQRTPADMIGRCIADFEGPEVAQERVPLVARVLRGEPVHQEARIVRPDGQVRFLSLSYNPRRDVYQQVIGYVSCLVDITESKQQALVLQRTLDQLQTYMRSVDQFLIVNRWDEQGIITYANDAFLRYTGYTRDEVEGAHRSLIRHPDQRPEEVDRFESSLANRSFYSGEWRSRAKAGQDLWAQVLVTTLPPNEQGQVETMAMRVDITPLKQREAELHVATQEAEAANRAKSDFVASVSHELRTPLNAILAMLSTLEERNQSEVDQMLIRTAQQGAEILLTQVNDILDFFKLSEGRLMLNEHVFSLSDQLESAVKLLRGLADDKGVGLIFTKGSAGDKVVRSDSQRLMQILFNLLSNAIKFTPADGQVKLSARCEAIDMHHTELTLVVQDSGTGMSAEFLPQLFQRFSQEQASRQSGRQGTGLGLAITKQLVDLFGGRIEVRSELGQGSTFTVKLPLTMAHAKHLQAHQLARQASTGDIDLSGLRVLYADDNAANRFVVETLLGCSGVNLELARDGQQAVDRVLEHAQGYDLVLMDLEMPVLDGLQATRVIRQHVSAEQLPIVALSANVLEEHRAHALSAGMTGFLGKPVRKAELLKALGACVQARRHQTTQAKHVAPSATAQATAPTDEKLQALNEPLDAMQTQALNFKAMEEFLGDAALVREVLPAFVEGLRETTQNLREAMPSGDLGRVRFVLHDLISMLGNLHAQAALAQLERVQTLARAGDLAGVQNSVPLLMQRIAETLNAAQALMDPSAAEDHPALKAIRPGSD